MWPPWCVRPLRYGAKVANRARVTGFLREGERVVGARVQDVEGGGEYEIRARQIVNATGVWTDDTQAMVGRARASSMSGRPRASTWSCPRTGSTRRPG